MHDRHEQGGSSRRTLLLGGVAAAGAVGLTACSGSGSGPTPAPGSGAVSAGPGGADRAVVNVVADFGAKGDGRTDDSAAFAAAYAHAVARVSDHVGRTLIEVPPGQYLVTRPGALLDADTPDNPANGLRFVGGGKRITEIVFRPDRAGAYLCSNTDTWANVAFEEMTFTSATPGASFLYSYSTGNAQDYRFRDCEWLGEWTYGLALDGSNTNSEMRWEACRVGGAYRRAFLYSGLSQKSQDPAAQDQFLNYWFTDMKVEYEWGNFLEFPYGGSITCRGGSYIVTGTRPAPDPVYGTLSTFFRLPTAAHAASVQRFHAEDIRFEVRNPDVVVIDSHWSGGTIRFNDCDDTANAFKSFAPSVQAHRIDIGPRGPLVRYDSCQLVGAHQFRTPAGAPSAQVVRYDMCSFANQPQTALTAATTGTGPGAVSFVDCLGRPG
ncbi:glycosyl hydrolase family 28-related protein [Streptacidiphilus sp. PB12-B1b]|uniref:glycosyl hydrolase family 28-related protein n=1 Tax=Streptacidiphilus sp. PB12-B1b TaxID=2705012 RepID=UPI0015FCA8DC|nr:glycosyl hydrolase family 28-related protein [Streptacidiphilus sp. PB12-B1b]